MSDTAVTPADTTAVTSADTTAVNVFTHSSTGFPGAWTNDEIDSLLDAWYDVIEEVRAPKRRSNAFRVLKHLQRKKGFRDVDAKEVRQQMNIWNEKYKNYLSMETEVPTEEAKCYLKLEKILGPGGNQLQNDNEADYSQRASSVAEDTKSENIGANSDAPEPRDEEGNRKRRSQGRMNVRRVAQLQQSILSEILTLQKSEKEADEKIQVLLTEIVDLHKTSIENQMTMIEALKALKM